MAHTTLSAGDLSVKQQAHAVSWLDVGGREAALVQRCVASDESACVTGGIYPIDSGYTAFKAKMDVMGLMQKSS